MRAPAPTLLRTLLTTLLAVPAAAQTAAPVSQPQAAASSPAAAAWIGEIDFGGRLSTVSGDPARYQRLRDLREGPTIDRFRYQRDADAWKATAAVDHAGYRDQRYSATFQRYGRWKASVDWNQIPLFYSADTRTPLVSESAGVLRLDEALRGAIQNGAATSAAFVAHSRPFDLRSRRDLADLRFAYAAARDVDLKFSFLSSGRTGAQPWGASFGQTNAVELPVPIDHRTNDINATAEWSNGRGMARLAYDGSWFNNDVETLVWDNPLRLTDAAATPARGRMALWPDSTAHTVSAAGSIALPARTRAFGYVSIGSWLQDQALLPFTVNTAIAPIPLARPTAEAEARIVSMNYRVTSRPAPMVWLNGQFRVYDYDNRTPRFPVEQYVRADSGAAASLTGGSEPFGYVRHFVDLDASFTPLPFTAFRIGYGREHDDRTFRFLEETTEQVVRAAVDSTGLAWGSVRLQYEHAVRTGDGLDEQVLSDIGEQVSLRQFDISDRTRDRVTAIVQVVPMAWVGLNGSVGIGQENRPDAAFGLQDNDLRSFTVGADVTPRETVTVGATYGFERYTTLQRSRQANPGPQFDDPTRDWSTDMNENVHTLTTSIDLPEVIARTSLRVAYDYVRSHAQYLYLLPANSTLTPPQQLPPVRNEIQRASADLRRTLTGNVALGVGYAYDRYDVDDFALSPGTLNSPVFPTLFSLMYQWRPYTAHTGSVRIMYRW
jgi:MtrB/PioB family decaheme-associated outer membrane protein